MKKSRKQSTSFRRTAGLVSEIATIANLLMVNPKTQEEE